MDFAKKILNKYGWKEGEGLGKNNTGIAAPLKASLKFDNAGLGVDRAQEFNDHWWERCFNEAANNVEVQVQQNGQVSTNRKQGEEAVEISTKGFSARKLRKAKEQQAVAGAATYDNFLQTALLTQNGGEVDNTERIKVEDIAVTKVSVLTDEELFKACGGRTAHKGARHGLKLSGKLARIEQQEREMLEKLQSRQKSVLDEEPTKKKKKRDKSEQTQELQEEAEEQPEDVAAEPVEEPVKYKKKKRKTEESIETEAEPPVKSKKKKKKHKHRQEDKE
ncbi:GL13950 [Drosophila persimilis]|uniref:G patch domain-containing protein 4 n=1 Tax=Drosophila persimilis TaxID=7234 RepID=B4GN58_DROPE|nr:G patch domain-containing protein 4 [Drosophila persimilis]EDW39184.1 GL13950 [Drosophila persimilis]